MMTCIPWKFSTFSLTIVTLGLLSACTSQTQQAINSPAPNAPAQTTEAAATSPSSEPVITDTTAATKAIPAKSKDSAKTPARDFRRVSFAAGKNSTQVEGQLGKYGSVKYVMGASRGQTLRAGLVTKEGCQRVTLAMFFLDRENGLVPMTVKKNEEQTNLKTPLPSSGDYVIQVQNADYPACQYSLSLNIQ